MKIHLGKKQTLKASWKVDFGMYLEGDDEGKILLPTRYVPEGLEVGDDVEVFIYLDNEERRIATTLEPKAQVGEFACLEVAWINEHGAFLDWGLMKDLFCPFREQKKRMEQGRSYIVHVHIDEESYRIMASAKVERYLSQVEDGRMFVEDEYGNEKEVKVGDKVKLLIWQKTDLGFKCIIENKYAGLIYDKQVFRQLHTGDVCEGYISNIRPDGKIDIELQKHGREHTTDFAETLLRYLQYSGGRCHLGDKSDAEDIKNQFHVSKKTYKRAIGDLYKRHLIVITDNGIELV